ncbi:hypothetical protein ALC57_15496, partial [Trachymyrmex cornetzi]
TLADTYSMATLSQRQANVCSMSATGCHTNLSATSAQCTLADPDLLTTLGQTSGQRWQYVGNRLSHQSRRDVGPTYVSRPLLTDDGRVNVGSTSATGCHTNLGATSALRTLADAYLLTTFGPTLAVRR